MRTSSAQCLAAIATLSQLATAIPLAWPVKNLIARAPQSYSVVAVDGGSSTQAATATATAAPATKTVTDATTQVRTATATILSTIIATPSNAPSDATPGTQIVSQTVTFATTVTQPVTMTMAGGTVTPAASTVTVEPSVSSVPFDNGQWHTTYYFKSTVTAEGAVNEAAAVTPTPAASTPSASVAAPTSSVDLSQWAYWNGRDTNQGQDS